MINKIIDNNEDLFVVTNTKREPKIQEGEYIATVKAILADEKVSSENNKWIRITLIFAIENSDFDDPVEIKFFASKNLNKMSRLYPIVKGIIGYEPEDNFNLKTLKDKKTKVLIKHKVDDKEDVWENVVKTSTYLDED
ncbi:hypothetical protein [Anaerovorax odorimutans]|uniref:hypothetical protein n=1 Tax=Anaerovorax odorimutans TaxID=109327 RepID=UPI000428E710|nr:hypothetical protein [Anaerovorax odorimutans]